MFLRILFFVIIWSSKHALADDDNNCLLSDINLKLKRDTICASLVGPSTPWCLYSQNITAEQDWPNQAVYVHNLINTIESPNTCLNTSYASDSISWLETFQSNITLGGSFMQTWVVFQVQYYDMPRKAGDRIEAPDTLGRKCWAFAYLDQLWNAITFTNILVTAGLSASKFIQAYNNAIPETMTLCSQVLANCFINSTYTPSRNGTCPGDADLFFLGFERENALRNFIVTYPFFA
jgi:hypothetical protein